MPVGEVITIIGKVTQEELAATLTQPEVEVTIPENSDRWDQSRSNITCDEDEKNCVRTPIA